MAVEKPRKMRLNGWEEIIKNGLKNNILIKNRVLGCGGIVKWYGILIKWCFRIVK